MQEMRGLHLWVCTLCTEITHTSKRGLYVAHQLGRGHICSSVPTIINWKVAHPLNAEYTQMKHFGVSFEDTNWINNNSQHVNQIQTVTSIPCQYFMCSVRNLNCSVTIYPPPTPHLNPIAHSPQLQHCCWALCRSRRWQWLETWSRTYACSETWWLT